ncbi:DUF3037 domain-containing protein [Thalassospira sp.]|uniref:DUF3037 domain-containing protein n=1 Tax=Thalassospira sp. TaxID=1912094 RepID=UPI003AA83F89
MNQNFGYYSIIQFCPNPERFELINVGIAVKICNEKRIIKIKNIENPARAEKAFGKINRSQFSLALNSFSNRVRRELEKDLFKEEFLIFQKKRANQFKVTPLKPIKFENVESDFELIFKNLVGETHIKKRNPSATENLKKIFVKEGVYSLLDKKPAAVILPEYDLTVKADFGYQNGTYNLINAVNMNSSNSAKILKDAGEKAIEGSLLHKHFSENPNPKKLVVVAEFGNQPLKLFYDVRDILKKEGTNLYRMDDLKGLIDSIHRHVPLQ